jgi:multiple sugar transport system permease protein
MRKSRKSLRNGLVALAFLAPNLLGFLVFMLIPILTGIVMSFFSWDGANLPRFVGLENFIRLTRDSGFLRSIGVTFLYTLLTVPTTVAISIFLAVLLTQKIRFLPMFRAFMFFPYIASIVAISIVWQFLYSPDMGPINEFLRSLGFSNPPRWTSSKDTAIIAIAIMNIWRLAGYYMVLFTAGIQSIPTSLYDAGLIDGANFLQRFWHITRPMLGPTTFFVIIISIINSFQSFTSIYIMTGGGPGYATQVLVFRIYEESFVNSAFGYASAQAAVLFAIVLAFTVLQFRWREKSVFYMS